MYGFDSHAYDVRLVLIERFEENGDDFAIVEIQTVNSPAFRRVSYPLAKALRILFL